MERDEKNSKISAMKNREALELFHAALKSNRSRVRNGNNNSPPSSTLHSNNASPPFCALRINNNLNAAEIATVETKYENSTFVVGEEDTAEIATVSTEYGNTNFVIGDRVTIESINTLKKLQEMLRIKDKKVAELKALLAQRDAEIQELRRKLEMYRNVLPLCSPYGSITKHRPQGGF